MKQVKIRMMISVSDVSGPYYQGKEYVVDYDLASNFVMANFAIALDDEYLSSINGQTEKAMEAWKNGPGKELAKEIEAGKAAEALSEGQDKPQLTTVTKKEYRRSGCNCSRGK